MKTVGKEPRPERTWNWVRYRTGHFNLCNEGEVRGCYDFWWRKDAPDKVKAKRSQTLPEEAASGTRDPLEAVMEIEAYLGSGRVWSSGEPLAWARAARTYLESEGVAERDHTERLTFQKEELEGKLAAVNAELSGQHPARWVFCTDCRWHYGGFCAQGGSVQDCDREEVSRD